MELIYPVIIETDEEGGYSGFFPDLPGCAAAGDTIKECLADAVKALALHLAGMVEEGEAFPEPTRLRNVKADPDVRVADILLVSAAIA